MPVDIIYQVIFGIIGLASFIIMLCISRLPDVKDDAGDAGSGGNGGGDTDGVHGSGDGLK